MDPVALDRIIERLIEVRSTKPGKLVQLSEAEIKQLCVASREIFMKQPNLLELEAPIKICGIFWIHFFNAQAFNHSTDLCCFRFLILFLMIWLCFTRYLIECSIEGFPLNGDFISNPLLTPFCFWFQATFMDNTATYCDSSNTEAFLPNPITFFSAIMSIEANKVWKQYVSCLLTKSGTLKTSFFSEETMNALQ